MWSSMAIIIKMRESHVSTAAEEAETQVTTRT